MTADPYKGTMWESFGLTSHARVEGKRTQAAAREYLRSHFEMTSDHPLPKMSTAHASHQNPVDAEFRRPPDVCKTKSQIVFDFRRKSWDPTETKVAYQHPKNHTENMAMLSGYGLAERRAAANTRKKGESQVVFGTDARRVRTSYTHTEHNHPREQHLAPTTTAPREWPKAPIREGEVYNILNGSTNPARQRTDERFPKVWDREPYRLQSNDLQGMNRPPMLPGSCTYNIRDKSLGSGSNFDRVDRANRSVPPLGTLGAVRPDF